MVAPQITVLPVVPRTIRVESQLIGHLTPQAAAGMAQLADHYQRDDGAEAGKAEPGGGTALQGRHRRG